MEDVQQSEGKGRYRGFGIMVSEKGENFRIITMIPNKEPSYSLKVKDRVKGLEKGWQRLRTVAVKCQGNSA